MNKRKIILVLWVFGLIHKVNPATFWFTVGTAGLEARSMAVCGQNAEYIVQGKSRDFSVYTVDWEEGTSTRVHHFALSSLGTISSAYLGGDNSNNLIYSMKKVVRFRADPGSHINQEEYLVNHGNYFQPVWGPKTVYMFFGSGNPPFALFRVQSDRVTGLKEFPLAEKSRTYGVMAGTSLVLASMDNFYQRVIYDYTNGYIGATTAGPITIHIKSTSNQNERGFISPEDERGYYVVSSFNLGKIHTVKVTDGTEVLSLALSQLGGHPIRELTWVYDTDLAFVGSSGPKFALANFMDRTLQTPPSYYHLSTGYSSIKSSYLWKDKKVLILGTSVGDDSLVYQMGTEMPCSGLCETCDGIFRKKCLSCKPNSSPSAGSSCACDIGFREAKKLFTTKECLACSPLCGTCSGNARTDCGACRYSYMEKKGDGSCGCPEGKYLSGTECLDCDSSCVACSDGGPDACLSCEPSSHLEGSRCVKTCPEKNKFKPSSTSRTCNECSEPCEECQDFTGECLGCLFGFAYISSNKTCQKIEKPLAVKKVYYSALHTELEVAFNQVFIANTNLNSQLKIELKDPQNSAIIYQINHAEIRLDDSSSRLLIKFDFEKEDKSFEEHRIEISEVITGTIKAQRDNKDVFKSYPIAHEGVTFIKSGLAKTSVAVAQGTNFTMTTISLILMITSISMAIIMIKLFQLLFFLLFININLPSNASKFLYSFRKNILDYFPTILRLGENKTISGDGGSQGGGEVEASKSDESFDNFCVPHKKFEENDQTCSSFVNLGSFITQLLIFLALKLMLLTIIKLLRKKVKKSKIKPKISSKDESKNQAIRSGHQIEKTEQKLKTKQYLQQESLTNRNLVNNGPHQPSSQRMCREESTKNTNEVEDPKTEEKGENQLNIFNHPKIEKSASDVKILTSSQNSQKSQDSCLLKMLLKIDSFLNLAYFFNLFKVMELRAIVGTMVGALSLSPNSLTGILNTAFSVIVIAFYMFLIISISLLVRKKIKSLKNEQNKSKNNQISKSRFFEKMTKNLALFDDLKEFNKNKHNHSRIVYLSLLQDLGIPLALTIFVEYPTLQIILSILIMAVYTYKIIKYSPFKAGHINLLEAGNRLLYIAILIVFLINHLAGKKMGEEDRFFYIGFLVRGLVSVLIGFNITISVWQIIKGIRDKCCGGDQKAKEKESRLRLAQNRAEEADLDEFEKKEQNRVRNKAENEIGGVGGIEFSLPPAKENAKKIELGGYQKQNQRSRPKMFIAHNFKKKFAKKTNLAAKDNKFSIEERGEIVDGERSLLDPRKKQKAISINKSTKNQITSPRKNNNARINSTKVFYPENQKEGLVNRREAGNIKFDLDVNSLEK